MTERGYIGGVYGQGPIFGLAWGGSLTSNGITRTVARMKGAHSLDGDCYDFNQVIAMDAKIKEHQALALPTILLCYSLGVSAGTWYQTGHYIDLLICIAGSSLGTNYPIRASHCGRSVLISGDGPLSDWGRNAGFSWVTTVAYTPHLLMDFHPAVTAIVDQEVSRLVK